MGPEFGHLWIVGDYWILESEIDFRSQLLVWGHFFHPSIGVRFLVSCSAKRMPQLTCFCVWGSEDRAKVGARSLVRGVFLVGCRVLGWE